MNPAPPVYQFERITARPLVGPHLNSEKKSAYNSALDLMHFLQPLRFNQRQQYYVEVLEKYYSFEVT